MTYKPVLTKSKYMVGLKCKKSLWIMFNEKWKIPLPDEITQFRFDQGYIIDNLAKTMFKDGIDIPSGDFKESINMSKELLEKRKPLFEAGFLYDGCYSRADILVPVGDDEWDVYEVKSSTTVKDDHINDLSFQKHCYENSGLKIRKTFLILVNKEYVREGEVEVEKLLSKYDITSEVEMAKEGIQDRIDEMYKVIGLPVYNEKRYGKHCDSPSTCPFPELDWGEIEKDSVLNLYYGGKKAIELYEKGIFSISAVPTNILTNKKQEIQVNATKENKNYIDKKEIKSFIESLKYPLFFLDFECYSTAVPVYSGLKPYQHIPFQFSLHIIDYPGLPPRHISFLADENKDPRNSFMKTLKESIKPNGSIIVYHDSYEKNILRELAKYDKTFESFVLDVENRVVDLIVPFRNFNFYSPLQCGSCSLKNVLPSLTNLSFDDLEIKGGELAAIRYYNLVHVVEDEKEKKKIKEELEKYCSLDTLGMVEIVNELNKLLN